MFPPLSEAPFDRTYEGLKRVEAIRPDHVVEAAFDRTYEGLKHKLHDVAVLYPEAFDRTYEGLKLLPRQALQQGVHVF